MVLLKGFEDRVFYVWFDAPIDYISILMNGRNGSNHLKTLNIINLWLKIMFHFIFPSCLFGTGDNYTLVGHLSGVGINLTYKLKFFSFH